MKSVETSDEKDISAEALNKLISGGVTTWTEDLALVLAPMVPAATSLDVKERMDPALNGLKCTVLVVGSLRS